MVFHMGVRYVSFSYHEGFKYLKLQYWSFFQYVFPAERVVEIYGLVYLVRRPIYTRCTILSR